MKILSLNLFGRLLVARQAIGYSKRAVSSSNCSKYETEYRRSIERPEEYWGEKKDLIEWFEPPKRILDKSNSPFEKWYLLLKLLQFNNSIKYDFRYCEGKLNAAYNCLDVHVKSGHGDQIAVIHDSPVTSTIEKISHIEFVSLFS